MNLITLGCSWVFGIGSYFDAENPVDRVTYNTTFRKGSAYRQSGEEFEDDTCWRNKLCDELNLTNINLSRGGSSNQSQFRRATKYFAENEVDWQNTVVLWGITSIYRDELWFNRLKSYSSVAFSQANIDPTNRLREKKRTGFDTYAHFEEHFDEKVFMTELKNNILHWQHYLDLLGVPYAFYETLNTTGAISNPALEEDMCTTLARRSGWRGKKDKFHFSDWFDDCNRIQRLMEIGMVNPYSFHPTRQGNLDIVKFMKPIVEKML